MFQKVNGKKPHTYTTFSFLSTYIIFFLLIGQSCSSKRSISYLQNPEVPPYSVQNVTNRNVYKPALLKPFEKVVIQIFEGTLQKQAEQYTVTLDEQGNINLPLLGQFSLGGLNTKQAGRELTKTLKQFYNEPLVEVARADYQISVLGEVNRPGVYASPNEKITIFEALSLAGDLTIYGLREKVQLIRETPERTQIISINITSSHIIQSPYYYLQPNDILYIEPSQTKAKASDAVRARNYALISAALSVAIVLISRINF